MHSSSTPTPPIIPGYTAERMLGCGATAQVWLVTSMRSGEIFAAKVISRAPARDECNGERAPDSAGYVRTGGRRSDEVAGNLRRELQLLTRLDHQHLIHAREVFAYHGTTVLLMDFAAGGSLAALVSARGPLPVAEVITIMTPIAGCVAYLHAHGVMHADLSPGNVLFTAYGKPLLADVGLSTVAGEGAGTCSGTPGFTDPYRNAATTMPVIAARRRRSRAEDSAASLAPASDVYALGALTWYALTGRVPATSSQRPPLSILVPDVPAELALLIEAALDADSSVRPTAAAFERTVFRSAPAAPVDLREAVHESVLPQLLTRRDLRENRISHGAFRRLLTGPTRLMRRLRTHWRGVVRGSRAERADGGWRLRIPMLAGGLTGTLVAVVALGTIGGLLPTAGITSAPVPATGGQAASPTAAPSDPVGPSPATAPRATAAIPGAADALPDAAVLPPAVRADLISADPVLAVQALARLRAYALNSGQLRLLGEINAAGSGAMAADRQLADRLRADGQRLEGLRVDLPRAQVLPGHTADRARVAATVVTSAYQQRTAGGALVRSSGETEQELIVALRWEQGRWLIDRILAPAAGN